MGNLSLPRILGHPKQGVVIAAGKPGFIATAGVIGLALIVYLMMFKPFMVLR